MHKTSNDPQLQNIPTVRDKNNHFEWSKPSATVGTLFSLIPVTGVGSFLWERGGTTLPVAFSHRHCRAVKQPACSKIMRGAERVGLMCKAIGCREARKIITLHRKTKCLLNHFKQYRTMWCTLWAAPQNTKISWGKKPNNQKKFNKLIIIVTVGLLGDPSASTSTINKMTLGHYVAITWTWRENCNLYQRSCGVGLQYFLHF